MSVYTYSSIIVIFTTFLFHKVILCSSNSTAWPLSIDHAGEDPQQRTAGTKMSSSDIDFISKYMIQWQSREPAITPTMQHQQCFTCALESASSARTPSYIPLVCKETTSCRSPEKSTKRRPGFGFFSKLPEILEKGKRFLNFGISITNNFAINLKINMTQQDVSYMTSLLSQDFNTHNPQRC